ncbi:hypothetical protein KP509_21G063900 [Ceratopteris richardii]|uniref:RRM domain-containing protein n=1 Tax=Ceratopteris richardii TaxID=49495 RepID=A0A8T2SE12_CERRI|nr:hypothetical protein KP509_21G063900 [Ceratopteris richardii]
MVSASSSPSEGKKKALDPSARDFIPLSTEPIEVSFYDCHGADHSIQNSALLPPDVRFPMFSSEYFPHRHPHHLAGFPAPFPVCHLPSYEWPATASQPRFPPEWQGNAEGIYGPSFPAPYDLQRGQFSSLYQQQFPCFQNQPYQTLNCGIPQVQRFHEYGSEQQRHSISKQSYGVHSDVHRLTDPNVNAVSLHARTLTQNYPFRGTWGSPQLAVGQPALQTAASTMETIHHRPPGMAQPFVGRDRMSRALQLIDIPVEMNEAQLAMELSQWGEIRVLDLSRQNEGLVTVHYFDLRSARSALTDIQNQHLLHQQRVQQQLRQHLRSLELDFSSSVKSPANDRMSSSSPSATKSSENESTPVDLSTSDVSTPSMSKESAALCLSQASSVNPLCMAPLTQLRCSSVASTKGLVGGKAVWAHYTIPIGLDSEDCIALGTLSPLNQGTLVVFNVDACLEADVFRTIFERYGNVKEVREAPHKRQHKFVEFYDVRHAALALQSLDGTELEGRKLKIEFSRPGGNASRTPRNGAPTDSPISMTGSHFVSITSSAAQVAPNMYPQTLVTAAPESFITGAAGSSTIHRYAPLLPPPLILQPARLTTSSFAHSHLPSASLSTPTKTDFMQTVPRYVSRQAMARGTDASYQNRLDALRPRDGDRGKPLDYSPSKSLASSSSWRGNVSLRRRAPVAESSSQSKDCFRFDEDEAESTGKTTLMIRNIPNKYTQEMLIAMLDEHCMECNRSLSQEPSGSLEPISAFDFVYLPIDFKNRCNLGYAFVNLTTPQATRRLHRAFHGRQWDEFNSRKICEVSYARLQMWTTWSLATLRFECFIHP